MKVKISLIFVLTFLLFFSSCPGLNDMNKDIVDLTISSGAVSFDPVSGNIIFKNIKVKNNGIVSAKGFDITFFLTSDDIMENGDDVVVFMTICNDAVAGGKTLSLSESESTFSVPGLISDGDYRGYLCVNKFKFVKEGNYKNNYCMGNDVINISSSSVY